MSNKQNKPLVFALTPANNKRLAALCGEQNKNLKHLEIYFNVEINNRGHEFFIYGSDTEAKNARKVINILYEQTAEKQHLVKQDINFAIKSVVAKNVKKLTFSDIVTPKLVIKPRTPNQLTYIENMNKHDVNFGVGPAGTGKTYLAVAYAVNALENARINRIIIARPIVEAGEKLGYLPGDIAQKVDPYLRPIYDALYEMLGFNNVSKLIEENIIEIAPLAFMRGRTLNDAVIILDEAQNTTIEQMKMFLTRLGFGSKAIITGDVTQTDLPKHQFSGLVHALKVLHAEPQIGFCNFDAIDIVRHPLVQRIVRAYEYEGVKS
jgi:phosphate starvation-inducible PhoH-like protein